MPNVAQAQLQNAALLASAGAALLLTQYLGAREIGSTFFSTELVLLMTTVIMLAGPSVGYAVAHRVSDRALVVWGAATFALQLTLPTGVRALVALASPRGLLALVLAGVLLSTAFVVAAFYAVFLPRRAGATSLSRLYAAELAGGVLALVLIAAAPSHRFVIGAHGFVAASALGLATGRRAASIVVFIAAAGATFLYPRLDLAAGTAYYGRYHSLASPVIVQTEYSPYQRVEVVDDALGSRSLFLDGVYFFRSRAFEGFNVFLAEVPGGLRATRGEALVVGSGSFLSAALLHRLGYDVTVVELDEVVARLGFFHFADVHGLVPGAVRVEIADARRYLAQTTRTFDVIALDVPAPYHLQTALLHGEAFYRAASAHLRPGGVVSMSLCGTSTDPIAGAIIAGAGRAFSTLAVLEPAGSPVGYLYAGNPLPFDHTRLAAQLARDPGGGRALADREVRALAAADAIHSRNLGPTLMMARGPLAELFLGH